MPQVAAEKVVEGEESSPQSLKREPNPNDLVARLKAGPSRNLVE